MQIWFVLQLSKILQEKEKEMKSPQEMAREFHDTYERLAPQFGYETRKDTKQFDPTTPNGKLMMAVCDHVVTKAIQAERDKYKEIDTRRVYVESLLSELQKSKEPTGLLIRQKNEILELRKENERLPELRGLNRDLTTCLGKRNSALREAVERIDGWFNGTDKPSDEICCLPDGLCPRHCEMFTQLLAKLKPLIGGKP